MATISTVNFEDLFDFSPEPLEVPEQLQQPQHHHLQQQQPFSAGGDDSAAATPPSPASAASGTTPTQQSILSQSAPATHWGGPGQQPQQPIGLGVAATTPDFNTSVDQLLATLPETEAVGLASQGGAQLSGGSLGSAASGSGTGGATPKGKRGRKPGQKNLKTDMKSKLERSRQSARECRARKKLRYQYLDDLILEREKANMVLLRELIRYQEWCHELDKGRVPEGLMEMLRQSDKGGGGASKS